MSRRCSARSNDRKGSHFLSGYRICASIPSNRARFRYDGKSGLMRRHPWTGSPPSSPPLEAMNADWVFSNHCSSLTSRQSVKLGIGPENMECQGIVSTD